MNKLIFKEEEYKCRWEKISETKGVTEEGVLTKQMVETDWHGGHDNV